MGGGAVTVFRGSEREDDSCKNHGPVVLAVWAMCGSAWAQSAPKPKEFYFDEDRVTARPIVVVPGQGDAVVDKLAAMVQRDSRAVEARAQLGTLAISGGRRELGDQLS